MATFSFARLPGWVRRVEKVQTAVVRQATGDMLADIKVAPGINRGGSRQRGVIPRDDGALASSLQSSLYGSTAMSRTGEDSYALVAGSMDAGDVATFSWGGTLAPYARPVHYGAKGVPGTFWRDVAAAKWQSYINGAARRAKAEIMR